MTAREVFLLSVKTPTGSIVPFGIFSDKEKAEVFAKYLVLDYKISLMIVDAWTVADKEAGVE